MYILKKVIFSIFSLVLLNRSLAMMRYLLASEPENFPGWFTFVIAYLLCLLITGIFAFPGFVFPTSRLLPDAYYELRRPATLRQLYLLLGVRYFRTILMLAFWGKRDHRKRYFDGTRGGLNGLVFQTQQSEFGHLAAFVSIMVALIVLTVYGYYQLVAMAFLINVVGNFYPIILQRHHRMRIEKQLGRIAVPVQKNGVRA